MLHTAPISNSILVHLYISKIPLDNCLLDGSYFNSYMHVHVGIQLQIRGLRDSGKINYDATAFVQGVHRG